MARRIARGRMGAWPAACLALTAWPGAKGAGAQESFSPVSTLTQISPIGLAAVPARAPAPLYESSTEPYVFPATRPGHVLDDGSFPHGASVYTVNGLQFGFVVGPAQLTSPIFATVRFWQHLDANAPGLNPVNTGLLGSETFEFDLRDPGNYVTTPITLNTPLTFSGTGFATEILFSMDEDGIIPARNVTELFAGGRPELGTNQDLYWRDVNNDGIFESGEARYFGDDPAGAHLWLQLSGTANFVPEPGAVSLFAALAAGAVPLVRRRRAQEPA